MPEEKDPLDKLPKWLRAILITISILGILVLPAIGHF